MNEVRPPVLGWATGFYSIAAGLLAYQEEVTWWLATISTLMGAIASTLAALHYAQKMWRTHKAPRAALLLLTLIGAAEARAQTLPVEVEAGCQVQHTAKPLDVTERPRGLASDV